MRAIPKIYHGFFSAQAAARSGYWVYCTPDGGVAAVTCITATKEAGEESYVWPDRVYVGPVVEFAIIGDYPSPEEAHRRHQRMYETWRPF